MNPCVYWVLLYYIQISYAVIYKLSDEEHELMPPRLNLDPFEKCLHEPGGRYCTAHVNFVADGFSPLLNQMQQLIKEANDVSHYHIPCLFKSQIDDRDLPPNPTVWMVVGAFIRSPTTILTVGFYTNPTKEYSAHSATHFNYTKSIYGVCMTHYCKNFYDNYTVDQGNSLEACLNDSLWKKYSLKVRVEKDVSCIEHNETTLNVGAVDIAVAYIVLGLVICNAVGSLIDVIWTKQDNGLVAQFLLCFSVPRNWKNLIDSPQEGSRMNGLKVINGVRAMSMILVTTAHAVLPYFVLCENPKFLEDMYDVLPMHIILNCTVIMQTFLFLSAFLLVYNSLVRAEKNEISWRTLPTTTLLRWLRLTPPFALVLAVTATWTKHFGTGPLWNIAVVEEAEDCRRYWWQHLLYINNYDDTSRCMPQAWYLAADIQLYSLGAAVFVFCRSPRSRNIVMSILFVIGLIIPALHTYYQDLDGNLIISPGATSEILINDDTFNNVYKRGHTNIPCYIMGMAFGYLVYNLQKNNFDASKYTRWRPLYWVLFPFCLIMCMLCKLFYEGPKVALIYRVLTSLFMKAIFGLLIALTTTGAIFKIENVYRGILEWQVWTPLARVSYSVYLVHGTLNRIVSGMHTNPVRISHQRMAEISLLSVVAAYIAATLFWLTVEAPLTQLVKKCFSFKLNPRSGDGDVQKKEAGPEKVHKE